MIRANSTSRWSFARDRLGNRQQLDFLALRLLQPLDEQRLLEGAGGVAVDRLGKGEIVRAEIARALVQHLGYADHLPVAVAQWHAITALPVDLGVEAGILVDVRDDLGNP